MSNNLKIIKVSDLPESKNVDNTYFFGYETQRPIDQQSVKIPFSSVAKASSERRIAMVMESTTQIIPLAEPMSIYKATGKNLAKLEIKANASTDNYWVNIPLNSAVNIDLSAYVEHDALIRVTRTSIDNICTVYLFTKVKIQDN